MRISDFDYELPADLIAQQPSRQRHGSRLMVVDRSSQTIEHKRFIDLPGILAPEDLLVLNNSRVIPARLWGHRPGREEKIEVLLLRRLQEDVWEVLSRPGRKTRPGTRLVFQSRELEAVVLDSPLSAVRRLRFEYCGEFSAWMERLGETPLPPYIDRQPTDEDRERYQTVFARVSGSVAAPTAGLHFSSDLLGRLSHCEITLHVGYGTFKPVSEDCVERHRMDAEHYRVAPEVAGRISRQLGEGRRVIAVGTTSTRTLEQIFIRHGKIVADEDWTDLFIYPGFDFRVTSGLLTNFHLPRTSLLLLVCAFAGKDLIQKCYQEAIERRYRFYSYGDAMLIL